MRTGSTEQRWLASHAPPYTHKKRSISSTSLFELSPTWRWCRSRPPTCWPPGVPVAHFSHWTSKHHRGNPTAQPHNLQNKQTSLKTPPCSWSHLQIFPTVALTFAKQRGGADLSDGASKWEAEWFTAGIHTERTASVVLQLHLVKVCRYCVKGKKHFIQW